MPLFDEILSEQDGVDISTLLQNMKNEFLKTLNLSDIPLHETAKVDPPEYMLELYNKFATDRTSMPSANIIRSFKNEGKLCSSLGGGRRNEGLYSPCEVCLPGARGQKALAPPNLIEVHHFRYPRNDAHHLQLPDGFFRWIP